MGHAIRKKNLGKFSLVLPLVEAIKEITAVMDPLLVTFPSKQQFNLKYQLQGIRGFLRNAHCKQM